MEDLDSWLRLSHVDLRARRAMVLLERFGSPSAVLNAGRGQLEEAVGASNNLADRIEAARTRDVSADVEKMSQLGVNLLSFRDSAYPPSLKTIYDAPICLYARGEFHESDRFAVAIVGTRQPTPYGEEMAATLARDLARRGLTVVSGMAYGIDTCAHRAALAAGGRTVAVLGCGVDIAYPRPNAKLLEEISQSGAVVSEFALGTPPEGWRFPARNRIISGLSLGVVVVDAPTDSGALITADFALEQGREIFAVPGPIHSETSKGPHKLLRDGATLVESVDDILNALGIEAQPATPEETPPPIPKDLDPNAKTILLLLSLDPRHTDDLTRETGLSASEVGIALMMLEIRGVVRRLPGSRYVRTTFRG